MHKFLLGEDSDGSYSDLGSTALVRGAIVDATLLVRQLRANHELGILESLILGHAAIGVLLMTSQLKGHDSVSFSMDTDGPAAGFAVEANAFGEVRGFLKTQSIPVETELDPNDYSKYLGGGTMRIVRVLEGGQRPFTSSLEVQYGNIANDLAYYYTVSEQTPTAIALSIRYDRDGEIAGAGGIKLQALPGALDSDPALIDKIEKQLLLCPSLGSELAHGTSAPDYVNFWFQDFGVRLMESRPVEFMCHCSHERFLAHLSRLPADEREELRTNGPFPLVTRCHYCGSEYSFSQEALQNL